MRYHLHFDGISFYTDGSVVLKVIFMVSFLIVDGSEMDARQTSMKSVAKF